MLLEVDQNNKKKELYSINRRNLRDGGHHNMEGGRSVAIFTLKNVLKNEEIYIYLFLQPTG